MLFIFQKLLGTGAENFLRFRLRFFGSGSRLFDSMNIQAWFSIIGYLIDLQAEYWLFLITNSTTYSKYLVHSQRNRYHYVHKIDKILKLWDM